MGTRTSHEPGTFSWVDLQTSDQEAAKSFYGSLFGWEHDDRPVGDGIVYTMCQLGGKSVAAISPLQPDQASQGIPPHWNNYVTVTSADDADASAREGGAQVLAEPFDVLDAGRMAVLADPTGAVFMVWEPRESIGAERVNDPGCLTWNELSTNDAAKAEEFYSGLFGWRFEKLDTGEAPAYWSIQHGGASRGLNGGMRELSPEQVQGGIPPNWMPYFTTESVEDSISQTKELGGESHFGPFEVRPGQKIAVLSDPQGAMFAVFEGEVDD
jgi:uncharacterized protein